MPEPQSDSDPLADLLALPDAQERLAWIVDRGKRLPSLRMEDRIAAHRVPGCVSTVWLVDESAEKICRFRADADAPVLRGLVGIVCQRASGRAAAEVAGDEADVVALLKLERHLTPTRVNGLRALQAHIRAAAARAAMA